MAPHIYKLPGRSPKQRKRVADEPRNPCRASRQNRPIKCVKCKREVHNAGRYKAGITSETPWERRQRLQKQKAVSYVLCSKKVVSSLTSASCVRKWF